MKISLTIECDVEDAEPGKEEVAHEIVAEEARGLAEALRQRLAVQGMTDIQMSVKATNT